MKKIYITLLLFLSFTTAHSMNITLQNKRTLEYALLYDILKQIFNLCDGHSQRNWKSTNKEFGAGIVKH